MCAKLNGCHAHQSYFVIYLHKQKYLYITHFTSYPALIKLLIDNILCTATNITVDVDGIITASAMGFASGIGQGAGITASNSGTLYIHDFDFSMKIQTVSTNKT